MQPNQNMNVDQYKQLMANYLKNLTPDQQKTFMENLKNGQMPAPKTAKEKLREKIEEAKFKRLPKRAQKIIREKAENTVSMMPENSHCCDQSHEHGHTHDHTNNHTHDHTENTSDTIEEINCCDHEHTS